MQDLGRTYYNHAHAAASAAERLDDLEAMNDVNVEGAAAASPLVDQSILDPIPLPKVGDEIDIVYHMANGNMTVDAIL